MNPDYLWLTGAMEVLAFFAVGPVIAAAIAYAAWRGKSHNSTHQGHLTACVASGVAATLLFAFAKWVNADVRTSQYFLQFASVVLSGLLFGVFMGCGFSVLLRAWRWHKSTRLADGSHADR